MKLTQKDRVAKRLLQVGKISRNECLKNFISRLSAIIQDLEVEGWVFETKQVKGDYVYKVVKSPYKKETFTLPDGRIIERLTKI